MDEASRAAPWLSIIGIGEDGLAGLGTAALAYLAGAETVFGGARHLRLAAGGITGEAQTWPSPFSVAPVLALRGRRVAVLTSGDPMWHGAGASLLREIPAEEARVFPHASAASLAAARLGWPLAEVTTLSLHGRDMALLRPHLHPGARLILLTSGAEAPAAIAALLAGLGFGDSRLALLEALGGPEERLRTARAAGFALAAPHPLNTLAVEVVAAPDATWLPRAPGLPDALFEHDGQLTKREARALALSALRPFPGGLLWDVGAGAGSIGIEWMLAHPACRAIGIEARADRATRAAANAAALGVPGLRLVVGEAPAALAGLPAPDAIFLGGGANDPGVFDAALEALKPGGVFVAHAVTLETEALLLARHAALGGEMLRINLARAEAVGSMTGWRAAMPVTQWIWRKP
ncbi:precorrin-6y C5,15-methyltransferase (decarboxylating) subunit CbiE [Roseococcus suduntuyensis]|uniref:Precorrin-6Y C5,15-methyltransferase (Decarboxylating) n=1 Tax=Roseococcus suduntuyensis TaxID=455361 RepID=A0A840AGY7_9PROT|nr:precorrin-6y C5,15-methyltransferase (decarboxylating) subunit CbiE [Roseococcus suduntuyensis]MBB3899750.1 precorrin-6Y C5,15-methyltransferase (decarboxylating) [Roseococcus suduntuyensis]